MKTIEGADALRAALASMGRDWARREGAKAVSAGARVVREEAKMQALKRGLYRTGALVNNIVMKRESKVAPDEIAYHVGVRHGLAAYKAGTARKELKRGKGGGIVARYLNDPFYWWWYEFGFKTRNIAARPFLRPAFEARKGAAVDAMIARLRRAVDKLSERR